MKHIKTFEALNQTEPNVGDYVIVSDYDLLETELSSFLNNNIGQLIKKTTSCGLTKNDCLNKIKYYDIPEEIRSKMYSNAGEINVYSKDIKYWSANKEELETILQAKKFNI